MTKLPDFIAPLFVPANRPERFSKAAASGADAIILDLEDAVSADSKDMARTALCTDFTQLPVVVRINALGTPWHLHDLDAVSRLPFSAIMVPKAERVEDLAALARIHPIIALIETVRGIAAARDIAASGHVGRLAFGSVDYAADLECEHEPEALAHARAELVFASRLAGLPQPLDGVTTDISEDARTDSDAVLARKLGFGGKMLIHPRQAAPVIECFQPGTEQIDWAYRVLASGDGAAKVDGAMVDEPIRRRARRIIARLGTPREPAANPTLNRD